MAVRYVPPRAIVEARARLRALERTEDDRVIGSTECPLCRASRGAACRRGARDDRPGRVPHRERRVLYSSRHPGTWV